MFAMRPCVVRNLPVHAAAVVVLAAVSLAVIPAHGFGLKDVVDEAVVAAGQNPEEARKPVALRQWERERDEIAGELADRIEKGALAAGKKGWDWLEERKKFGAAAKKIARRYGAAVSKGLKLAGPVGQVVNTWGTANTIGGELIAPLIAVPLIERYFDRKWEAQEEELRQEVARLRHLGEQRRKHQEDLANLVAVDAAMRMLREDRKRETAPADPWSNAAAPGAANAESWNDPWAPASSARHREARPGAAGNEGDKEISNYEAVMAGQRGGARSTGYRQVLERLEAERVRQAAEAEESRRREMARVAAERRQRVEQEAAERQRAKREAAERRRAKREAAERRRADREAAEQREAAARAARQARAASRSYSSAPSPSSRSSESSSTLFGGSGSSRSSGLFKADSGLQALRDIDARQQADQRRHAERIRRQQEEFRRQQEAARREQELQRQRQRAAFDRQQERQREAEARRQQEEMRRRQEEARRQRAVQERQRAEARRQQQALVRQQAEARRRQEEQRRRQEQARRKQAANAATAAHCLQQRQLKGGFNVSDVVIRNGCSFPIEVAGACKGTSFKANYPYKGTYSPFESMGLATLNPGRWYPAPSAELCHRKGRTVRFIACRKPFTPYFTSPTGSGYGCFE